MRLWATLERWWWLAVPAAGVVLAWPEMRGWGIWTWIGCVLAVALVLVVYAALVVGAWAEEAAEDGWEALRREQERAREHVAAGLAEEEE